MEEGNIAASAIKRRSCCTDFPTTIMFKNNILVCQNYDTKRRAIDPDSLTVFPMKISFINLYLYVTDTSNANLIMLST